MRNEPTITLPLTKTWSDAAREAALAHRAKNPKLHEHIADCLSDGGWKVDGKPVVGQPMSSLKAMLMEKYKSLGSDFEGTLTKAGYKISAAEGNRPRQRGSRELVHDPYHDKEAAEGRRTVRVAELAKKPLSQR